MNTLSLAQVSKAVAGTLINPVQTQMASVEIDSVVIDNRLISTGCLFVAIKGERFDGHDFIQSAFEQGATAAISDRIIENTTQPYILVNDTRIALLDLARYYRRQFSGLVVGITGSVGKTTTKEMIATVLSAQFKTLKTQGNFNNEIGLPRTIFGLDSSYQTAVIEMGMSHSGEISALSKTALPDVGVITNIGVSHMENLGSRENICKAKLEILDGMASDAPLILNGDNDLLQQVSITDRMVVLCAIENSQADYRAINIVTKGFTTEFDVVYKKELTHVSLPAIGQHNVLNALFGFCIGKIAGMENQRIAQALANYQPTGMRQNTRIVRGITLIEDCYNASPDSMKAALTSLQQLNCSGRRIAVLGDMLELGSITPQAHFDTGVLVAECGVDALFCYGTQSQQIASGAKQAGVAQIVHANNKQELSEQIENFVQSGDCIIFKASRGMRLEDIIEEVFDK